MLWQLNLRRSGPVVTAANRMTQTRTVDPGGSEGVGLAVLNEGCLVVAHEGYTAVFASGLGIAVERRLAVSSAGLHGLRDGVCGGIFFPGTRRLAAVPHARRHGRAAAFLVHL